MGRLSTGGRRVGAAAVRDAAKALQTDDELAAALALAELPGVGPATLRPLLDRFGSAQAVLRQASRATDLQEGLRRRLGRTRAARRSRLRQLSERGISLVAYGASDYPGGLDHLHDPPLVLYLQGSLRPAERRAVAVVGTRRATPYGRRLAREIAGGLAEAGWTVVSGMAGGVDGEAHAAALDAAGGTIGVLGSGFDFEYPACHRSLYRRMRNEGLLLSEFAPSVRPAPGLFPRRNRLIAALAEAVVVVQAPGRSGALITADHALDIGREVFGVPGPVGLEGSVGVHRLLRDGAALATCAADVIDHLAGPSGEPSHRRGNEGKAAGGAVRSAVERGPGVSRAASRALERLGEGPATADELVRELRLSVPDALALIATLELDGILRREADGRYASTARPGGTHSASGAYRRTT